MRFSAGFLYSSFALIRKCNDAIEVHGNKRFGAIKFNLREFFLTLIHVSSFVTHHLNEIVRGSLRYLVANNLNIFFSRKAIKAMTQLVV